MNEAKADSKSSQERRRFKRVSFDSPIRLESSSGKWDSVLIDISLKGALVKTPPDWVGVRGDHFTLTICLAEGGFEIRTEVSLVHHDEAEQLGFLCEHIDIESISHLRRLLELNLGDPEELERELHELG